MPYTILGRHKCRTLISVDQLVEGGELNCQARRYIGFQGEGDLTVDKDGVVYDAGLAILQAHRLQCNALDCSDVK